MPSSAVVAKRRGFSWGDVVSMVLKQTHRTCSWLTRCVVNNLPVADHSLKVPSRLPVAIRSPVGLTLMERTPPLCPVRVVIRSPLSRQSRTVRSSLAESSISLSGLKHTSNTRWPNLLAGGGGLLAGLQSMHQMDGQ